MKIRWNVVIVFLINFELNIQGGQEKIWLLSLADWRKIPHQYFRIELKISKGILFIVIILQC